MTCTPRSIRQPPPDRVRSKNQVGPRRPRLRACVPEGGAEAGHLAEATVGDEALRGHERRDEARVVERHEHDTWFASAAAIISSASPVVHAIGLSTSTCLPAVAAAIATSWCSAFGVAMTTASTSSRSTASSHRSDDGAAAPFVARASADARDRLANAVTSAPSASRGREVDVVGGVPAADDGEPHAHDSSPARDLAHRGRDVVAVALAVPDADRDDHRAGRRAPRCGDTSPARRCGRSGAPRTPRARPCPTPCAARARPAFRYTGRPRYICAHGTPSARSAAANRLASVGSGRNHVMLDDPSPSGSGTAAPDQTVDLAHARRRSAPCSTRSASRIAGNRSSWTPATAPASSPMRRFSPANGSVSSSPRALA